MITIVDYGLGNLASIKNMLKKIHISSVITSDPNLIANSTKLILPGVGSFDFGMEQLKQLDLISILNQKVLIEKTPILGICLGMQLLTKRSEEGVLSGLGWIDAETLKFDFPSHENLKVPNMGWNEVSIQKKSRLTQNLENNSRFYFVHSYYVKCNIEEDTLLKTNYGIEYTCAIEKENIFGVQFHPEKSHKFGMHILNNFSKI